MAPHRIDTKLVHAGEPHPRHGGALSLPIYQSSTFESTGDEGGYHEVRYARLSNTPNHLVLHRKLASLENAEAALVTSSGMAAITTTLLALVGTGDHVLFHRVLYGGTRDFADQDLPRVGVGCDFIDGSDPSGWESKLRPETKVLYVETITNPTMEVPDLEAAVRFGREKGLITIVDNTFASPVNFRPAELGFDLSVHSATKYLNGHSDLIAGAVIGRGELVRQILLKLDHLGGSLDPHACFLLHRGLKTLALRVRHQNVSALAIARWLERHPAVRAVNYPGLESSSSHARAARLLDGFGGMVSFELEGGLEAARSFCRRLRLAVYAPSLGGPESLVTRPAETSHAGMAKEAREQMGVRGGLVRLSVGLEATEDLLEDLGQALG